jgi:membrane protease YdiL (CAAX protease family)
MLTARPWKPDAFVRLLASVLICVLFVSAIVTTVIHFFSQWPHHPALGALAAPAGALVCIIGALFVLSRPWPYEKFVRNLVILLVCVYCAFFLVWLGAHKDVLAEVTDNSTSRIIIGVLSFQGASLILIRFFLREHHWTWHEAFGFRVRPKHALLMGLAVGMGALPVGWGLQMLSGLVMDFFNMQTPEQEAITILRASSLGWNRVIIAITAIVLAPLAEEILFRGILYPVIKHAGFPRLALWLSALLFGAIHSNLATFIPLTIFAIALVWLYERTGNLLASITAHSLFNTLNFIMLFATDSLNHLPPHK